MPALLWGHRRLAPSAPHLRVHTCKARPEAPDEVAFLGEAEELHAHYLRARQNVAGRSVPCEGQGCPHCADGEVILRNYYAPALLHFPGNVVGGKPVWERVVYYIPQGAMNAFGPGVGRGKLFKVWRVQVGSVSQVRSRYSAPVLMADPTFDVRPVLEHFFFPSHDTKAAVEAVFATLPPIIHPPVLNVPKDAASTPDIGDINRLRAASGKPPLTEAEALKLAKERIHVNGQSIADRERNGKGGGE